MDDSDLLIGLAILKSNTMLTSTKEFILSQGVQGNTQASGNDKEGKKSAHLLMLFGVEIKVPRELIFNDLVLSLAHVLEKGCCNRTQRLLR